MVAKKSRPVKKSELAEIFEPFLSEDFDDSLSEVTRRSRRNLLASSLVGLLFTIAELKPNEINLFGISSQEINLPRVLIVLGLVILYFTVNFIIYAYSDYQVRSIKIYRRKSEAKKQSQAQNDKAQNIRNLKIDSKNIKEFLSNPNVKEILEAKDALSLINRSTKVSAVRLAFDVWIPIIIALSSLVIVTASIFGVDLFIWVMVAIFTLTLLALSIAFIKRTAIWGWFDKKRKAWYQKRAKKIADELKRNKYTGKKLEKKQQQAKKVLMKAMGIKDGL